MENEYRAKNLIDFSYYMAEHLIGFTGREWVLREIQAFLDYSAVNTFILVGDPGIGKTSLSAKFIRSNPSIVTAFHFCSTRRGGWNDPIAFSKSLCTQLSLRFQEFPQMIADLQGISIHIDILSYVFKVLDFARNTGKDFFLQFLIQLAIAIKNVDKEIAAGIKNQVTAVQDFLCQLIPT